MSLVVDASVALKWVIDEDASPAAVRLLSEPLFAPELLLSECANGLWKSARRSEITNEEALLRIESIAQVPVTLSSVKLDIIEALKLAIELDHAAYDCIYLACARRLNTAMVTADRRFVAKAGARDDLAPHIRLLGT